MKLIYKLFFLIALPITVLGQNALQQEWIKTVSDTIGSTGFIGMNVGNNSHFLLSGLITMPDTAFGCTQCDSAGNALLLVTDSNGNKIYSSCYGGNGADGFKIAHSDKNGNIWALGQFTATNGNFPDTTGKDVGVVKFDSAYNPLWYHFYGSTAENDIGDFITTSDGGALILARTNYARGDIPYVYSNDPFNFVAYLCKLDSAGNIQWLKVLGGSGDQFPEKVKELQANKYTVLINTNSVDYMLAGINFDSLNYSSWFLEIDTGGHVLSSRIVHGKGFGALDFVPTQNDGLILACGADYLDSTDFCAPGLGPLGTSNMSLISIDSAYNPLWCTKMGGSGGSAFYYMSVINDSLVALFGSSESTDSELVRCAPFPESYVIYHGLLCLVNTNTATVTWYASFCCSLGVYPKGMVYDSAGQSLYLLIIAGNDGDFANTTHPDTSYNAYLFKYGLTTVTGINEISKISSTINLYPNPTTNTCTLKIDEPGKMSSAVIIDAVGRQVIPLFSNQQLSTFDFNCNTLSTGLYFVQVKDQYGDLGVLKLVKQ